ncbi:MAG TPA: FHA domain-containing protein [Polyangiaceae bacterium]
MGELSRFNGDERRRLLSQHLIGRGPECALRLPGSYVSTQHALVRWHGHAWEVLDRGSRNGTRLDGEPLEPGRPYRLKKGATITFGHADESWIFSDAGEPDVVLVALDDGEAYSGKLGLVGVPSSENPETTLFRDHEENWKVELGDGTVRVLDDGEIFESGGRRYRFSLPGGGEATASLTGDASGELPSLHFAVSADEEFVELTLAYANRRMPLGSRGHNYLLLTLARAYVDDQNAGLPLTSCGWRDKEELGRGLGISPEQVDGEVFRVRKHFVRHGLKEVGAVIERRARTKMIRLGFSSFRIDRL